MNATSLSAGGGRHPPTTLPSISTRRALAVVLAVILLALLQAPSGSRGAATGEPLPSAAQYPVAADQAYQRLPLRFEANRGQIDPQVDFVSRGSGYTLFLTGSEAVLRLGGTTGSRPADDVLRMRLAGAAPERRGQGSRPLTGFTNYLLGAEKDKWVTDVPGFAEVSYREVYPGVDLVYYGDDQQRLEYDFNVAPGADASAIALSFEGHRGLSVDPDGSLVVATRAGDVRQHRPVIYQEIDGDRRHVSGGYRIDGGIVRFDLGAYDHSLRLVIDPVLTYSSYLGGTSDDEANAVAVSRSGGFAYVTGTTQSDDFPSASPAPAGETRARDVFVAKFATNATGAASLVYATYLGGKEHPDGPPRPCPQTVADNVQDVELIIENVIDFIYGLVKPPNNPGQDTLKATVSDAFPDELPDTPDTDPDTDPDQCMPDPGPLERAYIYPNGTGGDDSGLGIDVDSTGVAYLTGTTTSYDFPTTPNAYDATCGAGSDGNCDFSTHNEVEVYIASDAFVAALNPAGSDLVYSTYLGGSGNRPNTSGRTPAAEREPSGVDAGRAIATDGAGNVYVTGSTTSWNFPGTSGGMPSSDSSSSVNPLPDAFLVKMDTTVPAAQNATSLDYGMYFGFSGRDVGAGVALSPDGAVYVAGSSHHNGFLWKFNSDECSRRCHKEFGGGGSTTATAVAVDGRGDIYVVGQTTSNLPSSEGTLQETRNGEHPDGFVASFNPALHTRYLTYLGGTDTDSATGVAVDQHGSAYVTGYTGSRSFPVKDPLQRPSVNISDSVPDAFIAKLAASGASLDWSTHLGGGATPNTLANGEETGRGIAVDDDGNAYVAGMTNSNEFPTAEALQNDRGGGSDAFLARIDLFGGARPTVAKVEPSEGPPGTTVKITGTGFTAAVSIQFGQVPVPRSAFKEVTDTQITAVTPVPDEPGQPADVSVRNSNGPSRSNVRFNYQQGAWSQAPPPPPLDPVRSWSWRSSTTRQLDTLWGSRLAMAGDLNGDGVEDFFVGAPKEDWQPKRAVPDGGTTPPIPDYADEPDAGRVYAVSGASNATLYTIDPPEPQAMGNFGISISVPGDLDGDGTTDVVIGADGADVLTGPPGCSPDLNNGCNEDQGRAWAFSGVSMLPGSVSRPPEASPCPLSTPRCIYTLDNPAPQGHPTNPARFGASIGRAGDVTGDGVADIVVGAPDNDVSGRVGQGQAFVFDGKKGTHLRTLEMSGAAGTCTSNCGSFGLAVQGPGDVDGDGVTDVLVSAPGYSHFTGTGSVCGTPEPNGCNEGQGRMQLFSGATGGLLRTIDHPEPQAGAAFGLQDAAPLSPGDLNGDGAADIYGAAGNQNGDDQEAVGRAWVFIGGTNTPTLRTLDDPEPRSGARFGTSVATTDYNSDATPDLYVGSSPGAVKGVGTQPGGTHVFDGRDATLLESLELPVTDKSNPHRGDGPVDQHPSVDRNPPVVTATAGLGFSVAVADLNGDGHDDYLGGAPYISRVAVFTLKANPPSLNATFTRLDGPLCRDGGDAPEHCGKVLVVGGNPATRLYDPKTEAWSQGTCHKPAPDCPGPLNFVRSGHSATLLTDGSVLVVSGNTSEVYQPASGRWSRAGVLSVSRGPEHTATLLDGPECDGAAAPGHCGKVLVVGGGGAGAGPELFDPNPPGSEAPPAADPGTSGHGPPHPGVWAPTAAPSTGQYEGHTATLLVGPRCAKNCGKVLLVGGRIPSGNGTPMCTQTTPGAVNSGLCDNPYTGTAEFYDPAAQTWSPAGTMSVARANHGAALLSDGRVLITGGQAGSGVGNNPQSSSELLDPAEADMTKAWRRTASMPGIRVNHTALSLPGGQALIVGGAGVTKGVLFDPRMKGGFGGWQAAASLPAGDLGSAALLWSQAGGADPANCGSGCGTVLFGLLATGSRAPQVWVYTPPPWVSSISATGGPAVGGVPVTISGAGFAGDAQVLFGRTPAPSSFVSFGEIKATSPAMASAITPVRVARNLVGVGSGPVPFVTGAPAGVSDLVARAISTSQIKLSFSAPGAAGGMGAPARSYIVKQSTSPIDAANFSEAKSLCGGACGGFEPGAVGTKLFLDVGGLLPDTRYHYAIKAMDDAGLVGEISNGASDVTHRVDPGEVADLEATAVSSSEIRLDFSAAGSNAAKPPPASAYVIKRSNSPIEDANAFEEATPVCEQGTCRFTPGVVGDPLELIVGGLDPQSTYHFAIRAKDDAENLGPISTSVSATTLRLGCVRRLPRAGTNQIAYPAGYSMVSLPAGTDPKAHSQLFSWFDQGAGGVYAQQAGNAPTESGRGYWAFGWCPRLVDLSGAGASSASFPLGAYRASMVGNPSGVAPATITGHDYTARWDPRLNGGAGGYRLSGYRQAQELAVGEGVWAFSYAATTLEITQR